MAISRRKRYSQKLQKAKEESGFPRVYYGYRGKLTYESDDLLPCACGARPVIEKDIRIRYVSKPAWLIRCPSCYRRVLFSGSYVVVRSLWNQGCYSFASDMVARPLRNMDDEGAISLFCAIVQNYYDEEKNTPPVGRP